MTSKLINQEVRNQGTFFRFKKNLFLKSPWFKYQETINYAQIHNQTELRKIIKRANLICKNTFIFTDRWDMEHCAVLIRMPEINWNQDYNGDQEWSYALVRFTFWKDLAIAYAVSKDEKYFIKAQELLLDFIKKEPYSKMKENSTWRTIDAGIRMSNLLQAIIIFRKSDKFNFAFYQIVIDFLIEHFNFLFYVYEDWKKLSNWGVIQNLPLLEFACLFEKTVQDEVLNEIEKRTENSAIIQIYEDGSHWEHSPMYHNEVLEMFCRAINLYQRMGKKWSKKFVQIVEKMHDYNLYISKPNRRQPMQGDSDDTILTDRFQTGALLFNRGDLKKLVSKKLEFRVLSTYGFWTIEKWKKISPCSPKLTNKFFLNSGNVYLRKNWKANADWLWFSNGPIGSGHGHGELLHLSLDFNGKSFFIDPGRYSYHPTKKERVLLKSNSMHNLPLVNDQEFQFFEGAWQTIFSPNYEPIYFKEEKQMQYLESGHFGYLEHGIHLKRGVLNFWDHFTIVIDFIYQTNNQNWFKKLSQNWILDNQVQLSKKDDEWCLTQQKTRVFLKTCTKTTSQSEKIKISKHYNELIDSLKISFTTNQNYLLSLISQNEIQTKKVPVLQNNTTLISEDTAVAYSLKMKNQEYLLYFAFKEITQGKKIIFVEGVPIYGKVVLVNKQEKIIYRLK